MGGGARGGTAGAAGGGLVVGLLGPVEVASAGGGLAGVARPMLRVLVAMLGVAPGRVVPDEALVDGLWGEEWSREREQNLHTHVSALRRLLAAGQPGRDGARVVRSGGGYRLVAAETEVDAGLFRSLAGQGRAAARAGDVTAAAGFFTQALGLWRGAALADVVGLCPRLVGDAAGLEELRAGVVEERLECDLALGRHGEVAAEAPGLVAAFPLRERLAGQVMVALYRCGRRGEALAVFDTTRRVLAEQLGLDPGPQLAGLQAKVLTDDPSLAAPPPVAAVPGFQASAPAGETPSARQAEAPGAFAASSRALPRDIASFTGRRAELARLLGAIDGLAAGGGVVSIHAIDGMAGVGKTTFAVHAAHQLAGSFPDGQFFLPLHAHTLGQRPVDPADALAILLLTAGVQAGQIPPGVDARAARWRDHAAGKKILLMLDDAASHEQVRPLLPGTAGSLVLITSRRRLAALEDAAVLSLDTLPPDEAAGLLARLAGRADVTTGDPGVGHIAALCGYLPLAIGMMGRQLAHHPAWTAAGLAADLAAGKQRLELMHAENVSVAAAFGLSYQDLTAAQRRLFRRVGLHPGPDIDAYAAAALDGTGVAAARRRLEALYDQHLITEPARGRYRFHDLIREHARALAAADDPAARDVAATRLLDYYLHTARAASRHIPSWTIAESPAPPGSAPPLSAPRQAAGWLEAERANLDAAAGYAATTAQPLYAVLIPAAMAGFLETRGYWDQGLVLHQAALAAARRAGDRAGQALALRLLGPMQLMTEDIPAATASATQALQLYRDLGDGAGQATALTLIGFLHQVTNDYPAAAAELRQALELFRGLGHRRGQGKALHYLGQVHRYTGDYPAAATCLRQGVELCRDTGHRWGQAEALIHLGAVQQLTGDYPAAAATLRQALALGRDLGDRLVQAQVLTELAAVQRLAGDNPAAAASSQQALGQLRDLGEHSNQPYALNELGLVQQLTGDYPAAAASHQQALEISRDTGERYAQAEALNSLGELSTRTAASQQARDHHTQALAIARDLGVPLEQARALEGIGHSHVRDANPTQAAAPLRDALAIYQRIGSPAARRVEETLRQSGLSPASAHPAHDQEPAHQRPRPPHSSQLGIEQQLPADEAT